MIAIARKAQQRICKRLTALTARGKPRNKAIAAARELVGFRWAVGQIPQPLTM